MGRRPRTGAVGVSSRRKVRRVGDVSDDDQVATALRALDSARGRFVAVVGHELRTPMTTLRGMAEELVRTDDAGRAELAPAVLRSARRVEGLLDALLLATEDTQVLDVGEPTKVKCSVSRPAHADCKVGESTCITERTLQA